MAAKHRVYLTGSERAEAEHVLGRVFTVDKEDPRFVLLTDEQEEAVRLLPRGIPPHRSQDFEVVKRIRAEELGVAGIDNDLGDSNLADAFGTSEESGASGDGVAFSGKSTSNSASAQAAKEAEADEGEDKPASKSKASRSK